MTPFIIDAREPHEFAQSHVVGAVNIPPAEFMGGVLPAKLQAVAKGQPVIVYCRSGARSNTVMQILRMHEFTNVMNGINEHHVARLLKK